MIPLVQLLLSAVLLVSSAGGQEKATFEIEGYAPKENKFLVADKATRLRFTGDRSLRIRAIYRPGSTVTDTDELEPGSDGWIVWTPRSAGLVLLEAYNEKETIAKRAVSITFDSTFSIGVVVMILAGLALFGGAFFSIRALLSD